MKLSIGLKIGTGFGAAIIMVVAIAFVSLRGLKDFQDASAWREHTFQVIDQIERIRVLDSGTKTAIRDFALTGDSLCIRDHAVALARLIGRLPDLRELTADNPNQQHRIDLLSQAIAEKNAASMAYLPVLNGQRLPLAVVKTGVLQGAGARDSITAILSAMRDEEKKLLALREASVVVRSRNLTLILVAGSAAISAAMFLIFFFLTNHITGSLRELLRGTEAIERREFNERVAVRSHDELGDLGKSFNTMAAALADGEKAVQDFERLFSMSSDLICVSGYDGYFKRVNAAWERTLGFSKQELLTRPILEFIHPDDWEAVRAVRKRLAEGESPTSLDIRYRHINGSYRLFSWTVVSIPEAQLTYASGRDVTEAKRRDQEIRVLNVTLESQNQNLKALNNEIEAFSYSVSHDLRAPLRSIDGFSHALLAGYNDKLDEQGKDFLRRVRAAAQRMGTLIDDILELSRISRIDVISKEVDLSSIARGIADDLLTSQPERNISFHISENIMVQGDDRLLRIALENMLRNSWKYSGKHPTARVEFGVHSNGHGRTFFVRDDGAGFDMAYADKLFAPFQRLHGVAEFEGTGVGLATVARIIAKHGGRIWAEAEVEKGATFYFTLDAGSPTS